MVYILHVHNRYAFILMLLYAVGPFYVFQDTGSLTVCLSQIDF